MVLNCENCEVAPIALAWQAMFIKWVVRGYRPGEHSAFSNLVHEGLRNAIRQSSAPMLYDV